MPAGTKTFMRQKITLASSSGLAREQNLAQKNITVTVPIPEIKHTVQLGEPAVLRGHSTCTMGFEKQNCENMETEGPDCTGCICSVPQKLNMLSTSERNWVNSTTILSGSCPNDPKMADLDMELGNVNRLVNSQRTEDIIHFKSENEDFCQVDTSEMLDNEHVNNSTRANEGSASAGALRYALHLRFLCLSKKPLRSIRRCKSDPLSVSDMKGLDSEGERHFYLYNDLRVVFPQRHSDSDEGKLHVEHHFPADPKYFDIDY